VLALVWGVSGTSIVLVEDILKLCVRASVYDTGRSGSLESEC
jgi:hypothetical protein